MHGRLLALLGAAVAATAIATSPVTLPAAAAATPASLTNVSCYSPSFCLATSYWGHTFEWNGTRWRRVDPVAPTTTSA